MYKSAIRSKKFSFEDFWLWQITIRIIMKIRIIIMVIATTPRRINLIRFNFSLREGVTGVVR